MFLKLRTKVNHRTNSNFTKIGVRVDLFLPLDTKLNFALNQSVKEGETIIVNNE